MIITISGCSGSGKTMAAKHLIKMLGGDKVCYLHQDAYYKDQGHLSNDERSKFNYDHPDAVELDLFAHHLDQLASGHIIEQPVYDFKTHTRLDIQQLITPKNVIIADGIFLFCNEDLRKLSDVKVFVSTDSDMCFIHRLTRDIRERDRSMDSVIDQYIRTVKPMQNKYILPLKDYADYIIHGDERFMSDINYLIKLIVDGVDYE